MIEYEYMRKESSAFFILQPQEEGLLLTFCNERCCELLSIPTPYHETKLISTYINSDYYNKLVEICSNLANGMEAYRTTLHYPYQGSTITFVLNIISVTYANSDIFICYAIELENFDYLKQPKPKMNNQFMFDYDCNCLFTLQYTNDHFIQLINYNDFFLSYFPPTTSSDAYELTTYFTNDIITLMNNCVKQVLNQNFPICKLISYNISAESRQQDETKDQVLRQYIVQFIPTMESSKTVICCVKDITKKIHEQTDSINVVDHDNFLYTTPNAAAIFDCEDRNHPKIERINAEMLELIAHTSVLQEPLFYESNFLKNMFEKKETTEEIITVHHSSKTVKYKVMFVPVMKQTTIIKAIIIIQNIDNNMKTENKLTPREQEIIRYVLSGEKNEYIANKLCVSIGTIKRTVSNVYAKLGISSRIELLKYFHSLEKE